MIASFADMEDDVHAAREMADALFVLVEVGVLGKGIDAAGAKAILRLVCHLQRHTDAIERLWLQASAGAE